MNIARKFTGARNGEATSVLLVYLAPRKIAQAPRDKLIENNIHKQQMPCLSSTKNTAEVYYEQLQNNCQTKQKSLSWKNSG